VERGKVDAKKLAVPVTKMLAVPVAKTRSKKQALLMPFVSPIGRWC
jgi:hypothetical protein